MGARENLRGVVALCFEVWSEHGFADVAVHLPEGLDFSFDLVLRDLNK